VRYFIKKANEELKTNIYGISKEAESILLDYRFPGNVRELKNIIYSACLNRYSGFIKEEDIKLTSKDKCHISLDEFLDKLIEEYGIDNVKLLKKELEDRFILKVFEKTGNNISKTAKLLDISRNTLKSKLKKLNFNLKES